MAKQNIVVIGSLPGEAEERLAEKTNMKIWRSTDQIPDDQLEEMLADVEGFISRGDIKVDDDLLSKAPHLKVIAQSSVGYDNIDIEACTKRLIPYGNTPEVLNDATADLTYALLLTSTRKIIQSHTLVRNGAWNSPYDIPMGVGLSGKTLGIVGMGNIGRGVAKRAHASGMNVIYHNRTQSIENDALGQYTSFDELLESSDFIVVLLPLNSSTKGTFGAAEFKKMKSHAYFINASRGAIVDTHALYLALKNKEIAYAALDVTDPEPINMDNPIMNLDNVLITPHIGSATTETRENMASLTADNLLAGLNKQPLPACVNEAVNYKN